MDFEKLKHLMLFRGMTDAELNQCITSLSATEKCFKKGQLILHAGDTTDSMGLVLSGSVTIENNDLWGNCSILSHVEAGGSFAETYAMTGGEVLLVDVRANENCNVLFLSIGKLDHSSASSDPWKYKLIANLLTISSRKNLLLSGRSFHTSPKTIRGRVLSYLNSISLQKHSTDFDIPFDRQQLADYLNIERTALSKELGKMRDDGLIRYHKNHFTLTK